MIKGSFDMLPQQLFKKTHYIPCTIFKKPVKHLLLWLFLAMVNEICLLQKSNFVTTQLCQYEYFRKSYMI